MNPKLLISLVAVLFLTIGCSAEEKVTNRKSLDQAKSEMWKERQARLDGERREAEYRELLASTVTTARYTWVYRQATIETKDEARTACKEIDFALPRMEMLEEAKGNENLDQLLEHVMYGRSVYVEDANEAPNVVTAILCAREHEAEG